LLFALRQLEETSAIHQIKLQDTAWFDAEVHLKPWIQDTYRKKRFYGPSKSIDLARKSISIGIHAASSGNFFLLV
jgi:hypothetical protein